MSFPPERITVKRRRDEDPVNALCRIWVSFACPPLTFADFPPHKSRRTFVWNRVSEARPTTEAHDETAPFASESSQIPAVRTTLPEEDNVEQLSASLAPYLRNAVQNASGSANTPAHGTTKSVQSMSTVQDRAPLQSRKEPRKFHFTKTAVLTRNPSVLRSGIQKAKKKQKKKLAVFVERTDDHEKSKRRRTRLPNSHEQESTLSNELPPPSAELSGPRKRPLASLTERKWRDQNWVQPPDNSVREEPAVARTEVKDNVTDSLHLASQLQQFALDVSRAGNNAQTVHTETRTKVKPKPPRPRLPKEALEATDSARHNSGDAISLSEIREEDFDNFVFDVYVRQAEDINEKVSIGMQNTRLERMDPDRVGVLVIADEDQETWELYGAEDQSSDEDCNSEEEDENGPYRPSHRGR